MKLFGPMAVLREDDPGAGGGAGTLTEAKVNELIQAGLAAGFTKFKTEVPKLFEATLTPLQTQLTTITTALTELSTTPPKPGDKKKDEAGLTPELNAKFKALETQNADVVAQLKAEKEKREAAEAKERQTNKSASIQSALKDFQFASPEAQQDAVTLLSGQVEFDENGVLVAGGLPLNDFAKDYITNKKSHLLAATGRGGSGAGGGQNRGVGGGNGQFQMEQIKPGMSQEDISKAAGAITRALPDMRV